MCTCASIVGPSVCHQSSTFQSSIHFYSIDTAFLILWAYCLGRIFLLKCFLIDCYAFVAYFHSEICLIQDLYNVIILLGHSFSSTNLFTSIRSSVIVSLCVFESLCCPYLFFHVLEAIILLHSFVLRLRATQTLLDVHVLLLFLGDFHFISPIWLNARSVIRINMGFNLLSLTIFNWLTNLSLTFVTILVTWLKLFIVKLSFNLGFIKSSIKFVLPIYYLTLLSICFSQLLALSFVSISFSVKSTSLANLLLSLFIEYFSCFSYVFTYCSIQYVVATKYLFNLIVIVLLVNLCWIKPLLPFPLLTLRWSIFARGWWFLRLIFIFLTLVSIFFFNWRPVYYNKTVYHYWYCQGFNCYNLIFCIQFCSYYGSCLSTDFFFFFLYI